MTVLSTLIIVAFATLVLNASNYNKRWSSTQKDYWAELQSEDFIYVRSEMVKISGEYYLKFAKYDFWASHKEICEMKEQIEGLKKQHEPTGNEFYAVTNDYPIECDNQALSNMMKKTPFMSEKEFNKYIEENLKNAFKSNEVDSTIWATNIMMCSYITIQPMTNEMQEDIYKNCYTNGSPYHKELEVR